MTVRGETFLLHRADCLDARRDAAAGRPVVTMFGCQRLPQGYPWHECMHDE